MRILRRVLEHPWMIALTFLGTVFLLVRLCGPAGRAARSAGDFQMYLGETLEVLLVALALASILWLLYRLLLSHWFSPADATAVSGHKKAVPTQDRWHNPRPGHQYVPGTSPRRGPETIAPEVPAFEGESSGHSIPVQGREDRPSSPSGEPASSGRRPGLPPRLDYVVVDQEVVGRGLPVTVRWSFRDADWVSVQGSEPLPASGSTERELSRTGKVEVVAWNEFGRTVAHSRLVIVLPIPAISSVTVPAPPSISLSADVSGTIRNGHTAGAHLEALFTRQDSLRPAPTAGLRTIGVPRRLISWLTTHADVSDSAAPPATTTRKKIS